MLLVDIVVRNYVYIFGEVGIERITKRYVGTSIMAARLPSPTLEQVREKMATSPYYNSWPRPSAEELKWSEKRELELSVNEGMKDKLQMPVKSKSQHQKWLDNIRQNNPDRLDKRIIGHLSGESSAVAEAILRENNNKV